jgi:glycosyltransferase involved in cell wall biosynthesis
MSKKNDLSEHIKIKDWMDRKSLKTHYQTSSLFFFPSHEGAGMVVPEAMSYGLPTLCLDNNGPGLFINDRCGVRIPYSGYDDSVIHFSEKLDELFRNTKQTETLGAGARTEFEKSFLWDSKADKFEAIYQKELVKNRSIPLTNLNHKTT